MILEEDRAEGPTVLDQRPQDLKLTSLGVDLNDVCPREDQGGHHLEMAPRESVVVGHTIEGAFA